jgi:hypothetical protein
MADISKILGGSIKDKVLGVAKSQGVIRENPNALMKVIGKNFMALPGLARDLNVARQNFQTLVKLEGGKPAKGADAQFLKEGERAKKLEVETGEDKKPTLLSKAGAKLKEKAKKKYDKIKDQYSKSKMTQKLTKYLGLAAIVGVVFVVFKDTFAEWATGLFDAIKTKFDEFTASIGQWFNDSITPIIDKLKEFVKPIIDTVSGFFGKVGDFFVSYFETWRDVIMAPIITIKKVYDVFMGKVNKLIDMIPDGIKKRLGIKEKVSAPVDDSAERKKLERQQEEALRRQADEQERLETERVRKLEKEKQYTGDDEIVRARLGLPPKTESMRREEEAKKQAQAIEVAPPPDSILVPGPMPSARTGPSAVPTPPPKPITAPPPTAVGKAAEGPEKQTAGGGSLNSVASVQSGVDLSGLHPEFEKRLVNMATAFKEQTGKKILITSGYRSNEKQAELFRAKVAELGGDERAAAKLVARPMPPLGTGRGSFHLKGLAIDINSKGPGGINALAGSRDNPTGWLEKFGLIRNVPKEDWHIQPSGTLPTADNPENPGAPTLVAGKDGKPMDLSSGKKESIGQPEAKPSSASGGAVASASTDVASGQRQQAKPQTPIIVNAPTTNNQVVKNTQVACPKRNDVGSSLANAAA